MRSVVVARREFFTDQLRQGFVARARWGVRRDIVRLLRDATDRWTKDIDVDGDVDGEESSSTTEDETDPDAWRTREEVSSHDDVEDEPEEGDQKSA